MSFYILFDDIKILESIFGILIMHISVLVKRIILIANDCKYLNSTNMKLLQNIRKKFPKNLVKLHFKLLCCPFSLNEWPFQ